jgi:tetratricopeptide (TPR) repeat protein
MQLDKPTLTRAIVRLALVALAAAPLAAAQSLPGGPPPGSPPGLPAGVTREQMWPAPTADDWKKPCLIQWQRTWEDAVAVSHETGRPILVCINMDGEIASEHYAGVRYRQPEIAALYEPYVCVIASVYRHTPRDYDDQGRRIPCPRFGTVTCGEHIAIEPILFEKFMDGKRVAPRHIMVELDGAEKYDVYFAWDTQSVFDTVKKGIADRPAGLVKAPRGDRSIVERVASRDSADRSAVETAYEGGDRGTKKTLLDAAQATKDAPPVDLLRLAMFGLDTDLSQLARKTLAQASSPDAVDLVGEALRNPTSAAERESLIGALSRIGESSPKARTLATVHRGLGARSTTVDVDGWAKALEGGATYSPAAESAAPAPEAKPADPNAMLALAEDYLSRAVGHVQPGEPIPSRVLNSKADQRLVRSLFEDARRTALEAEKAGAKGWRTDAVVAVASYYLSDDDTAHARAETAVSGMPSEAPGWNAMVVLALFAEERWQAISKAVQEKKPWPPQWLSDVNAAYDVLVRHPYGTDDQVGMHYDIVKWLGGAGQAARVLDEGLARFPDSALLHERLRRRILEEKGVEGLEPTYAAMLKAQGEPAGLEWFAGYASMVAAEFSRRAKNEAAAVDAYDRAIAHFDRSVAKDPENRTSADLEVALALAGRARLALEKGDWDRAVADVVASFERKPDGAATQDGLNISPVDTAMMLKARLADAKRDDLAAKLQAALDKLDPEMLKLPAYEGEGGARRPRATSGR